ncbi:MULTISPECIES: hypothetical protein [unclassified Streptomyces]|uniref:hypothetical protein n=1 Tax=unclassified Streptomyces TaxID=2593676 RepID=UPI00114C8CFB|nr:MULTISPECIES: hypothetical protein [unclassified Streptomyces]MYT11153.1 hypothetical protein [Streptomyces sp. SID4951]
MALAVAAASTLLAFLIALPAIIAVFRFSSDKQNEMNAKRRREELRAAYETGFERWRTDVLTHDAAERRRVDEALRWFPVHLASRPRRIDVYGGTADGWASLLVTLGASLLANAKGLWLLDLSHQTVGRELAALADTRGMPVARVELPSASVPPDLSWELPADELAEVLAEALSTLRPEGTDIDLRATDASILHAVLERLDEPVTFGRIASGLEVLLRVHEPDHGPEPLATTELDRLTAAIDVVGQSDRVQNELRFVYDVTRLLARAEPSPVTLPAPNQWLIPGRLTILSTHDVNERRKDVMDRVLFFLVLHQLRRGRIPADAGTLVIAGAEHLGRSALEAMARQARIAGVRLVLLMTHVREDIRQLLGGQDSATVLMRLGNAEEAKAAADFIGQGHKFVMNQLTRQVGESQSKGRSHSYGGGASQFGGWSTSWQNSVDSSTTDSVTRGETVSRVYEFTVEPTQIQSLPPTGLILIETGPQSRRVLFGDCNPAITLLPRVADAPRLLE